jgi:glucokinase
MATKASGNYILMFDIGGTYLRGAAETVSPSGQHRTARRLTPNFLDRSDLSADELIDAVLQEMASLARELLGDAVPTAVVVGWPGPVTPFGVSLRSPTILGPTLDRPVDIGRRAARLWPAAQVVVMNDLTCAGYAYVGAGFRDFCIFTVGSGIANKIFSHGQPMLGPNGRGGEVGHLAAWRGSRWLPGLVEERIHLGDVASGRGTLQVAQLLAQREPATFRRSVLGQLPVSFDNEALAEAFNLEDEFARRAIRLSAEALAHAIASVHVLVGCEQIFLTGGFAVALGEPYRRMLLDEAREFTWDLGQDWDAIIKLGDDADGLRGGEVFARDVLLPKLSQSAA